MGKRSPEGALFFPGMGPEEENLAGRKSPDEKPRQPDRSFADLVEVCPGCGDEKGSNPNTCRACANYAKKNRR